MADGSKISWTDATWNPIRGCSRVSEGCRNCYAERVAARFSGPGQPYHGLADRDRPGSKWTGEVRVVYEHLADPIRWQKPRRIFVNSMSDLFHEKLTNEEIGAVFAVMAASPIHTFQVLTKRTARMRNWFEWAAGGHGQTASSYGEMLARSLESVLRPDVPSYFGDEDWLNALDNVVNGYSAYPSQVGDGNPLNGTKPRWPLANVWIGTSTENQETYDERIQQLSFVPAKVHFISAEPLLGPIDLSSQERNPAWLDWVIVGCESGHGARSCDVEWVRAIRDQCAAAGVALFVKQAEEATTLGNGMTNGGVVVGLGKGSKEKMRGPSGTIIELPYLDGVQHAAFPVPR